MSRLKGRVTKLETCKPSNLSSCRVKIFNDTAENVERQIAEESALAEDAGEVLWAVTFVPHIGETMNEFRKANGLSPMNMPGWDKL